MKKREEKIEEKALAYLVSVGSHVTSQRRLIVNKAFDPPAHYTAEELLKRSRRADSSISRATVYRTLTLLVQSGLLREVDLKNNSNTKHYDFNYVSNPQHNHIVCEDCGQVFEFEDARLSVQQNAILAQLGFKPKTVHLRIEASCMEFNAGKRCKRSGKQRKCGQSKNLL